MEKAKRLLELDVLRGMTVFFMIVVNNPGSWSHIYSPLKHASWDGCTPTDLVYPFFLFCVGLSVYFSFKKKGHILDVSSTKKILIRMVIIFMIPLLISIYSWLLRNAPFTANDFLWSSSYTHLRIMGVLQRIAIAYAIATFIALSTPPKYGWIVGVAILLFYRVAMSLGGDLSLLGNLARRIDLTILGDAHMYHGFSYEGNPVAFDPEGLFSTIPAVVSVLFGFYIGRLIDLQNEPKKIITSLLLIGTSFVLLGLLWNTVYPINKALWSSSYVIYTTGLACLTLSILIVLNNFLRLKFINWVFIPFGMNPLFIFVFSGFFVITMSHVKYHDTPLLNAIYKGLSEYLSPINASLAYALLFVAFMWLIAYFLHRKRIYIKI